MKYTCPKCGWRENEYRDKYCSWCGHQLPEIQKVDRLNPSALDDRMKELKRDIWSWITDVSECFHERRIDWALKNLLMEDFANWFLYAAGKENEKSLFYEEKTSEVLGTEINNSNSRSENAKNPSNTSKKRFRFLSPSIIWAYAAGLWTFILIQVAIRMIGYLCGIR